MGDLVKIFFPIKQSDSDIAGEWLWGKSVGNDRYLIDNSPFDIFDISCGDTVLARLSDSSLIFVKVALRGGHSTYRIRMPMNSSHEDFLAIWRSFEELGCSYEGAPNRRRPLYSIDVPQGADVQAVYAALEQGESNGLYEFEEAHFCKPAERN